jgi:hypothetical protein
VLFLSLFIYLHGKSHCELEPGLGGDHFVAKVIIDYVNKDENFFDIPGRFDVDTSNKWLYCGRIYNRVRNGAHPDVGIDL